MAQWKCAAVVCDRSVVFVVTVTLQGVGRSNGWTAEASMSEANKACVCLFFCAEGEQHVHAPYVYREIGGGLLVNRLLDTHRTHTCHVNRMSNPAFVQRSS